MGEGRSRKGEVIRIGSAAAGTAPRGGEEGPARQFARGAEALRAGSRPAQSHRAVDEAAARGAGRVGALRGALRGRILGLESYSVPPTRFGWTEYFNHRETFFEKYPHLRGEVWVHHAVEQRMLEENGGPIKPQEMHSIENLRGIPLDLNTALHLRVIRIAWNRFYTLHGWKPSRQQLLEFARVIDEVYGSLFTPQIQ